MVDELKFIPFEKALKIVGAIQEEEHIREDNRRIFTVYDIYGKELCWFDAEETIAAAVSDTKRILKKEEIQPQVEEYILNRIPAWVLDP